MVFTTKLCELMLLYPSLWFNTPRFPVSKYSIYRQCVVLSPVGDHILQEFNTRFRTYQISTPPPNKNLGGEAAFRKINTCRKIPLQANFLDDNILLLCLYCLTCKSPGSEDSGTGSFSIACQWCGNTRT